MATLPAVPPNLESPRPASARGTQALDEPERVVSSTGEGGAQGELDGQSASTMPAEPPTAPPVLALDGPWELDTALVEEASSRGLTPARRDAVRRKALGEIPWWYNPYAHLAATTGVGLVVLVISVLRLRDVQWTDLLVIPVVILIANFYEWLVHKNVLHRRFWPFEVVYDKHTPMHHMVYVEEDMALRSAQEFRLVLIPAAGVVGIVLAVAPLALGLAWIWSAAAGWLFLLTASLFMVSYELLHLGYHAPANSFVGRRDIIRVLRTHHARHHDPRLMQRYNFNVTVPLFDWIMGTMAPPTGGRREKPGKRAA